MGGPVSTVLKPIKQVADVVADPVTKVVQEAVKAPAVAINVAETPLKAATKDCRGCISTCAGSKQNDYRDSRRCG